MSTIYIYLKWIILSLGIILATSVFGEEEKLPIEDTENHAQHLFEQGQFEQAIQQWQTLLPELQSNTAHYIDISIKIAVSYQELGLSKEATDTLLKVLPLAEQDVVRQLLVLMNLSDLALATQQNVLAREYADKTLSLLSETTTPVLKASVLNNVGNVLTVEAYYAKAIDTYAQAVVLAKQARRPILTVRILLNTAQVYLKQSQSANAATALSEAWEILQPLPTQYNTVFNLLSIGDIAQHIQYDNNNSPITSPDLVTLSHTALTDALKRANILKNQLLISYAQGYLGHLYELQQQYTEALQLTRQAIFSAQQIDAKDILSRWQWQLGRILSALAHSSMNDSATSMMAAIDAYRSAVDILQPIRRELTIGFRNDSQPFRETIGVVYFELADLLLQQAKKEQDNTAWLTEAQQTIERFKTAELQDYFRDDCVIAAQTKQTLLDNNIPHAAILYPILLPDRIEILLTLPHQKHETQGHIQQFSIPIDAVTLKDEVNEFRFELETEETEDYLPYAQQLYAWLFQPLEHSLQTQQIDILIIVPDGVLRTIPFAALHDGQQFLINKYAFVTVPSLTLTESNATIDDDTTILISGLSKSVRGYTELSNVPSEVQIINQFYRKRATLLLDEDFTSDNFAKALHNQNYSIVHIASHGQFESNPANTFLLTYDDKLTMNRLEQLIRLSELRNEPMDLLALSACQTAVGDDQAALGVAGIAIKAGARSALATLWFIDDEATTQLITEFYYQLQVMKQSKVKALQNAQRNLLKNNRYQHPIYWAPFLLIGNWH